MFKTLSSSVLLGTLLLAKISSADVLSPESLLKKGYKALPTFEAVAVVDHQSNLSKSKKDLAAEDFKSLNQDPLFQALSKLQFNWKLSEESQAFVEGSKILDKLEATLSQQTPTKKSLLDLAQENGVTVININVLNNSWGKIDDSKLKASVFVGTSRDFKKEKELALSVNLILKKEGTGLSPSAGEIKAAILALLTK